MGFHVSNNWKWWAFFFLSLFKKRLNFILLNLMLGFSLKRKRNEGRKIGRRERREEGRKEGRKEDLHFMHLANLCCRALFTIFCAWNCSTGEGQGAINRQRQYPKHVHFMWLPCLTGGIQICVVTVCQQQGMISESHRKVGATETKRLCSFSSAGGSGQDCALSLHLSFFS